MTVAWLATLLTATAQPRPSGLPDSLFSPYYHQRWTLFQSLPQAKGAIIFAGNSITDGNEWQELFADEKIVNRGISGDHSAGLLHRFAEILERKPARLFLMIGVNDLAKNISPDSVVKNIMLMASWLSHSAASTRLYVQSILPVNDVYGKFSGHTSKGNAIRSVNEQLKKNTGAFNYTYVDLHTAFSDETGKLKKELSNDGLHLNGAGYVLWKHLVYPYVYGLQQKPSLLPAPRRLQWNTGIFSLTACRDIVINDSALIKEARLLEKAMLSKGLNVKVTTRPPANGNYIRLGLGKVDAPQSEAEAYRLQVTTDNVRLTANTAHGIFNSIQTLLQLMRDGVMIDACDIVDWPAFSWRGYMIDVGRNYQSMELLKQQIDVMAKYKLNVFHFHATEDIAWRLAIRQYPQLTAPEHMLRDKGLYYSEAEIRQLIEWCRERYITFLPEIDMPGHSAAFKRAMKTDMQSDSGLAIVKNILSEFCGTYDLPYIHIGADEVKIVNKDFVPEVSRFIGAMGKKVIGWEPGGNFNNNTIRQLWMDDNAHKSGQATIQYIDSRHLYLNHMDPLEAVVTIFNRRIGDKASGDANLLGATLCMWHDRAVANQEDVQRMNPLYPGMLAFAERSWRGDGKSGRVATIGKNGSGDAQHFLEFENRFLDHRDQYFGALPFPYQQQSSMVWKTYGPFDNGGNLAEAFTPERDGVAGLKPVAEVVGGTIVWRHWWAPLIRGVLDDPRENSTWYAATRIWSNEEREQECWIGFNNLSRSPATDSPAPGTWDTHQSRIWVNGTEVAPPAWKRAGQKGHPEIPLVDEGYEYRAPAKILLRKGWNDILVKSPIGRFKGKDWQNPEKWMFTFIPLQGSR